MNAFVTRGLSLRACDVPINPGNYAILNAFRRYHTPTATMIENICKSIAIQRTVREQYFVIVQVTVSPVCQGLYFIFYKAKGQRMSNRLLICENRCVAI